MTNLIGSDKQITWANEIRADIINRITNSNASMQRRANEESEYANMQALADLMSRLLTDVLAHLDTITDAHKWIDKRNNIVSRDLLISLVKNNPVTLTAYKQYVADKILKNTDLEWLFNKAFI